MRNIPPRPIADLHQLARSIGAEHVGLTFEEATRVFDGSDTPTRNAETFNALVRNGEVKARILPGRPPRLVMSDVLAAREAALVEVQS